MSSAMSSACFIVAILAAASARSYADARTRHPVSVIERLIEAAEPDTTIVVPPGEYHGHLRIARSATLDGRLGAIIDGGGEGTVIEILSPGVTIRGMTIRGSGRTVNGEPAAIRVLAERATIEHNRIEDSLFGIDLREAPESVIRGNSIRGKDLELGRRGDGIRLWWSRDCIVEGNEVYGSRDMVFWYSDGLTVARNRVTGSRYGLHFMYSHDTVVAENDLSDNSVGVYLMYSHDIRLAGNVTSGNRGASGYGIGLKDCDGVVAQDNALLSNRVGVYIDNSPSSVGATGLIRSNLIAFNEIGLLATPNTHDNVLTRNAFVDNGQQAAVHGRGELTRNTFAREGIGNFWSDYAGFDGDGDGLGDLRYEPRSLFSSLLAAEPNLRLFIHSPAQQAVEFTARALPELRPSPTLSDPAPLSRPPAFNLPTDPTRGPVWPMVGLGAGLLMVVTVLRLGLGRDALLPTHDPSRAGSTTS